MIEFKNVTKYFWKSKVLDNISFQVKKWEICGFIGENGAGKSTTMRILATLILEYSWEVCLDGKNIQKNVFETRKKIGFMPDQYGLYDDLTLEEYLDFFAMSYGLHKNEKRIHYVLDKVSLTNKKDTKIRWLSRWMTQRICLAKALINDPEVLILDEPASGLDPKLRIQLKQNILELKKQGKTIFVSSHILTELGEYCDSIVLISGGKIVSHASLSNLETTTQKICLLKTNDFEKTKKIFKNVKKVIHIKKRGEKLSLTHTYNNPNEILKICLENHLLVEEFIWSPKNLEDIYMHMLQEDV